MFLMSSSAIEVQKRTIVNLLITGFTDGLKRV